MFDTRYVKKCISYNIHTAEDVLAGIMATPQNPTQINLHIRHLKYMSGLTYLVEEDLMKLSALGRDHAIDTELKDFGDSIIDIGRRASAFYKDLCAREASISKANTNLLYARKAAHKGTEYRRQAALHLGQAQDEQQTSQTRTFNMFGRDLKGCISCNIHDAEDLLEDMIATAQNPSKTNLHVEHIKNMV